MFQRTRGTDIDKDGLERELRALTLYCSPGCLFCVKVRIALWLMGMKIRKYNVLIDRDAYDRLVFHGGKSQVPCLHISSPRDDQKTHQDRWLYESSDIVAYLKNIRHGNKIQRIRK